MNGDLATIASHGLSRAEQKGDTGPSPIVDRQSHLSEGFRIALCPNALLLQVGGDPFLTDDASSVPSAHRLPQNFVWSEAA
jgi:hypothetical protein